MGTGGFAGCERPQSCLSCMTAVAEPARQVAPASLSACSVQELSSPGSHWALPGGRAGRCAVDRVVDRVRCALGAFCAFCAFSCAVCAASALRAVGRANGKEKVYGSIP